LAGKKPFKKAANDLRAIAVLYDWAPMQIVVNQDFAKEHGINDFADLITKKAPVRISVNKRGLVVSQVIEAMVEAAGGSFEGIRKAGGQVVFAASKEMSNLIKDRRIDAMGNAIFVRHRSIRQPGDAVPLKLLNISESIIAKVSKDLKINRYTVKGGSYKWAPKDINTIALSAQLVTLDTLSDEDAHNIAKALVDHSDKMSGVHKAMKALNTKLMASSQSTPYHKGAERAYKAAGLR